MPPRPCARRRRWVGLAGGLLTGSSSPWSEMDKAPVGHSDGAAHFLDRGEGRIAFETVARTRAFSQTTQEQPRPSQGTPRQCQGTGDRRHGRARPRLRGPRRRSPTDSETAERRGVPRPRCRPLPPSRVPRARKPSSVGVRKQLFRACLGRACRAPSWWPRRPAWSTRPAGHYGLRGDDLVHATRVLRACLHGFVSLEERGDFGMPHDVDASFDLLVQALHENLSRWGQRPGITVWST